MTEVMGNHVLMKSDQPPLSEGEAQIRFEKD